MKLPCSRVTLETTGPITSVEPYLLMRDLIGRMRAMTLDASPSGGCVFAAAVWSRAPHLPSEPRVRLPALGVAAWQSQVE
jgi:hypothetical protein